MTLKITLSKSPLRMLAVCVAMALAIALGCGGGGSQAPIIASAQTVIIADVPAILESSEIPHGIGWHLWWLPGMTGFSPDRAEWKKYMRDSFAHEGFTPADSISVSAHVRGSNYNYKYIAGGLDFAAYRNKLDDAGGEEGEYLGLEVWGGNAILEDRGLVIQGDAESVIRVLTAFDRGEDFLDENESNPLKRAMDKAGGGLTVSAFRDCENATIFPYSRPGCEAVAETIKGGDAHAMEIVGVYLFSSQRNAEASLDGIDDLINEVSYDADFEEIKADGEFVTYRATIYAP